MRDLFNRFFGDILTDLGPLEGDYRFSQLQSDISQSILYMVIVAIGNLSLLLVDFKMFQGAASLMGGMVIFRVGYLIVTALFGFFLNRTTRVRVFDRLVFSWILLTVFYIVLISFTRPANYVSVSFDIIVPFAIYVLSPLRVRQIIGLALGFSVVSLYTAFFYKTGVDPVILSVTAAAQVIVHALGLIACLQTQTYRRKSYQAYIDEKDAKEMVAYLANIDPLTKSLTRRQFMNIAESEFRRFQRYHRPLSILILDADGFKQINDTYGHHAGDLVLRSLSLVAMEQKRAQDTFGRLGGEEFGLLMPETTLANAIVVADRICKVWEASPVNLDGELIHSTISIGVAEAASTDQSLEDLLRRADRMLYKAKDAGRNRVVSE